LSLGYCVERALVLADTLPAARRLAGMIDAESTGGLGIAGCAALPALGDVPALDWIEAHARSGAVDRVVLCADPAAMPRVNAVLTRLARLTIDVSILPDLGGLTAPVLKVDRIGTLPAVELDFRPLTRWQMMLKRAEDLVLAGLVTVFILPVLAVIAIAIKLDSPGPVLFRQPRAGFHDRVFNLWKFRTMHAHARDERAVHQTERNDPRVTRVGRILRRTSLDELPQLFNVLAGSMSIVGPRPHALGMTADGAALHDVIEDYSARHRLKPGITGWAQVNGCRGEIRTHEKLRRRVALDCYYIENWSLRLDLWIMARTAAKILNDSDAY
jgi:Undecaprenyl-phosphate glucose phosphotransferase